MEGAGTFLCVPGMPQARPQCITTLPGCRPPTQPRTPKLGDLWASVTPVAKEQRGPASGHSAPQMHSPEVTFGGHPSLRPRACFPAGCVLLTIWGAEALQ